MSIAHITHIIVIWIWAYSPKFLICEDLKNIINNIKYQTPCSRVIIISNPRHLDYDDEGGPIIVVVGLHGGLS